MNAFYKVAFCYNVKQIYGNRLKHVKITTALESLSPQNQDLINLNIPYLKALFYFQWCERHLIKFLQPLQSASCSHCEDMRKDSS